MKRSIKSQILCLDIGASKIFGAVFLGQRMRDTFRLKTPKNKNAFFSILENQLPLTIKPGDLAGIGLGLAGIVDAHKGRIIRSPHMPFLNGVMITKRLKKRFRAPTLLENDARAFTLGEANEGVGQGHQIVVGVTIGTGIGSGIVINGVLFQGAHGAAGEAGHMIIETWPNMKEWEEVAAMRFFGSSLRRFKDIPYEMLRSIDPVLQKKFKKYANFLSLGLTNIIMVIDPDVIVMGGGIGKLHRFYLPYLRNRVSQLTNSKTAQKTKIMPSLLQDRAIVLGLRHLVQQKFSL